VERKQAQAYCFRHLQPTSNRNVQSERHNTMTQQQKDIECAKLDGYSEHETEVWEFCYPGGQQARKVLRWFQDFVANPLMIGGVTADELLPYSTSYDAIIPLIQKQNINIQPMIVRNFVHSPNTFTTMVDMRTMINATPSQLQDALLRAHGFEV